MGLFLVAVALAAVASGAQANTQQCVSLVQAATEAGLTALLDAVVETAKTSEDIKAVLELAEVSELVPEDQQVTIFAPSNDAFAEMPTPFPTSVSNVLLNHVVAGELPAAEVSAAIGAAAPKPAEVTTKLGKILEATTDGDDVYLTPLGTDIMSKVLITDVKTCIGLVHVVEAVLVPDMPDEEVKKVVEKVEEKDEDVVEVSDEKAECVSLVQAATEAGLTTLLDVIVGTSGNSQDVQALLDLAMVTEPIAAEHQVTVFAPTNNAFAAPMPRIATTVADVLMNHVSPSELMAVDVLAAIDAAAPEPAVVSTLLGAKLEVVRDENMVLITPVHSNIKSRILATDVKTCAGTVHVIDTVLVPGMAPKTTDGAGGGYGDV